VDASFFPSSGAVNPALTIMANALTQLPHFWAEVGLRVGDHLTVTHYVENGKSMLKVSDDFKVPDTPCPFGKRA
jgi:hypothetical protein